MSNTQQKQSARSPPMLPLDKPFNLAIANFINRQNVPEIGAQIKKITHVFYDPLLIQTLQPTFQTIQLFKWAKRIPITIGQENLVAEGS